MNESVTITKEQYEEYRELIKFKKAVNEKFKPLNFFIEKLKKLTFAYEKTDDWADVFIRIMGEIESTHRDLKNVIE